VDDKSYVPTEITDRYNKLPPGERSKINAEVDKRFQQQIGEKRRLDWNEPKDRPLARRWLGIRDKVMEERISKGKDKRIITPPIELTLSPDSQVCLPPEHDEFSQAVDDMFGAIDGDADGFLSKGEINVSLEDPAVFFSGVVNGAAVATLRCTMENYQELSDDYPSDDEQGERGVCMADVTAYDLMRAKDPKPDVVQNIENWYILAKRKIRAIRAINYEVYLKEGDGSANIDAFSVAQASLGDCWLLAAIVAVALRKPQGPQDISNMINGAPRGPFLVEFPGLTRAVEVPMPTDAEIGIFAQSNGLWLTLLEKAYGAYSNQITPFTDGRSDYETAGKGGFGEKGIEIMTGNSVDSYELLTTLENTMRRELKRARTNRKIATASIRKAYWGKQERSNRLPMGHGYTVIEFDENTDRICLRNPWHYNLWELPPPPGEKLEPPHKSIIPLGNGMFELSIGDFDSYFSWLHIEQ
jgi:hypothetical protein